MTMLLADTTTSLDGDFTLKGLLFILLIFNVASIVLKFTKGDRPEKREITINPDVATKAEVERMAADHRAAVREMDSKMIGIENKLRDEIRKDVGELHVKVNQVSDAVARVETQGRLQADQLTEIREDIRSLMRSE